jgi:3-keto-5-aminohexanoate cleavage enzyme
MPEQPPMLIAVAPNGARYSKADHSALPISPKELAHTARTCLEAGAAMIHLHVRDDQGKHTISSRYYIPAIAAIRKEVGSRMIIQATSESAGIFNRHQQMQAMTELMPESVSIALRELIPDSATDSAAEAEACTFLTRLEDAGTLIQYIIYTPGELDRYQHLCDAGVIPGQRHMLLFVLGRYSETLAQASDLDTFVTAYKGKAAWMCCGFGKNEQSIMTRAAQLGGHARVGFENNMQRADGSMVADNSQLVTLTAEAALGCGRPLATIAQGRTIFLHGK